MTETFGAIISDTARLMRKRFDAVARRHAITSAQWRVLANVHRCPGITQGQLAERMEVEPITTCRMVDRLAQVSLIERRPDPDDRRVWKLYVTAAALPLMDQMREIVDGVLDQALCGLDDGERDMLNALLERVRSNLLDDDAFQASKATHG